MTFSTLKRGGRLRPRSEKREKKIANSSRFAGRRSRRDGRCLAPLSWGRCEGPWDPHHIVPRGRDRTLALVLSNIATLCRYHHDYAHANPRLATERGLLASAPLEEPPK